MKGKSWTEMTEGEWADEKEKVAEIQEKHTKGTKGRNAE